MKLALIFGLTIGFGVVYTDNSDDDDDFFNIFTTPKMGFPDLEPVPDIETKGSTGAAKKCGEKIHEDKVKRICVPYDRCDGDTNTVIPNPKVNLIQVRIDEDECEDRLDVCCKLPPPEQTPVVTVSSPVQTTTEEVNEIGEEYCGKRNVDGVHFKLAGDIEDVAEYGEFPWMVAILPTNFKKSNGSFAICGASLITPSVVLTAAHCVTNYTVDQIKIRAGEWDFQTDKEKYPYQERDVANIIIHEDFNDKVLYNNIALLILHKPLDRARNIGTICLPPQGQTIQSDKCWVTGWGKDVFGKQGKYSGILKKIDLPIVDSSKCQEDLRETRVGAHFILDESFTCAGGIQAKDSCTGDGGGPLVCPDPHNPERYVQAGIVSWGLGCGEANVPGVYADVAKARSWVDEQLEKLKIDTKPYNE